MLIFNGTQQIAIPYHNLTSVVVQPANVDMNAFFGKGAQSPNDLRDKPTDVIVTGIGVSFTEHYGKADNAEEAIRRLKMALQSNQRTFTFPRDEKYHEQLRLAKERKAAEERLKKPAYAQGENNGQE